MSGAVAGSWTGRTAVGDTHYRYIRIYNPNIWNGNLAEVEIYGDLRQGDA